MKTNFRHGAMRRNAIKLICILQRNVYDKNCDEWGCIKMLLRPLHNSAIREIPERDVPAWSLGTSLGSPGGRTWSVAEVPLWAPAWWSVASPSCSRSRRTPLPVPASPAALPWPLILPPPKLSKDPRQAASRTLLFFLYPVTREVTPSPARSPSSCVSHRAFSSIDPPPRLALPLEISRPSARNSPGGCKIFPTWHPRGYARTESRRAARCDAFSIRCDEQGCNAGRWYFSRSNYTRAAFIDYINVPSDRVISSVFTTERTLRCAEVTRWNRVVSHLWNPDGFASERASPS